MKETDLRKMVTQYIYDEYLDEDDDRVIKDNTALISSGIVDSFSMASLKIFLEKKFKIAIPDAKATTDAFDSVNNIITLLREYITIE